MRKDLLKKIFLALTLVTILLLIVSLFLQKKSLQGPFLSFVFIFLAVFFHFSERLKKYAYTVWIFAAVTISMNYPGYFIRIGNFDLKKLIVPLLQIIMFGMGSQLSVKNFADVIKMPKGIAVGIVSQFTIMPVVGFSIATLFNFPPEVAAGIVLVGSSPSGLASNVMSFIARANLALSVTLTAVATILAPLLTPALMKLLAGQFVPIDFWSMMLSITNIVILPILAGLIFNAISYGKVKTRNIIWQAICYLLIILLKNFIFYRTSDESIAAAINIFLRNVMWFLLLPSVFAYLFKIFSKGQKAWLDKILSLLSMVGIGIIITIITAAGRDSLISIGIALIIACLLHNIGGYFLGYWGCRLLKLDENSCRTIAIEVGMQNGGLASGIALEMGKVATVGLAPAVFGPMMNITGSSLANWWRARPADKKKRVLRQS